jgi:signal transduction histidine kinase
MVEESSCALFSQGGRVSTSEVTYCIAQRVQEKKKNYEHYGFERCQEEALSTFFDLAQEFTTIDSLYQICASVAREFFDLDSRIYIINPKSSQLELVCTSWNGLIAQSERTNHDAVVVEGPVESEESWFFPIHGNQALVNTLPFLGQRSLLGVFEVLPKEKIDERKKFFLEKFTNRIGYNLHQKLLVEQNINHIKFINQLVSDIEHNVITPNMYYRLFLIRLRKMMENYGSIEEAVRKTAEHATGAHPPDESLLEAANRLRSTNAELQNELSALLSHYEHTSLFLETLMRKDHFQKGTYVLRKQSCNFQKEVIGPLLDRYRAHFKRKDITLENRIENGPDEQVTLFVDKGLISQVFDNFFSNALKYAESGVNPLLAQKLFSLNQKILKTAFGKDKPGVRFDFFTTGKALSREECDHVFDEGFRAGGSAAEGKGHGLYFVKNVVQIHGGLVGCEPQAGGNLFYLVLPFEKS